MRLMFRATQAYVIDNDLETGLCTFKHTTTTPNETTVNLTLRTGLVPGGQVVVDDPREEGGFSELVPETSGPWEEMGCLYLEEADWQAHALTVEPTVVNPYELTAVYYTDDGTFKDFAGKRYHGFHAKILDKVGHSAYCRIWPAETSHGDPGNAVDAWVALNDPDHCDVTADLGVGDWPVEWRRLKLADGPESEPGALYINIDRIGTDYGQIPTSVPKLPPTLGRDAVSSSGNSGTTGIIFGPQTEETVVELQPAPTRPGARPCELCKMLEPRRKPERDKYGEPERGGPFKPAANLVHTALGHKRAIGRPTEPPLNVSGTRANSELLEIQQIVMEGGRLALVEDAEGLLELLRRALACRPARAGRTLDLIGHSVGNHHFLMLGSSIIDLSMSLSVLEATPTAVYQAFKTIGQERLLHKLGIRTVRLIGCRTAQSERGRVTIANLRKLLHADVQAVCDLVSASEFRAEGYVGAIANLAEKCPTSRWGTATFNSGFGSSVLSINRPSKAPLVYVVQDGTNDFQLDEVRDTLLPSEAGWLMHGLLARADAHVIIDGQNQNDELRSFEVLLDHELVRVYPRDTEGRDGVVYRVAPQQRQHLRDILARTQPTVLFK